mmetsp:Transcript_11078/g.46551  ORF Transcript_11078/g.46551 Transcript_11078/m.46551 type:complete len:208 (+) Transcript_11078:2046-2669(+)
MRKQTPPPSRFPRRSCATSPATARFLPSWTPPWTRCASAKRRSCTLRRGVVRRRLRKTRGWRCLATRSNARRRTARSIAFVCSASPTCATFSGTESWSSEDSKRASAISRGTAPCAIAPSPRASPSRRRRFPTTTTKKNTKTLLLSTNTRGRCLEKRVTKTRQDRIRSRRWRRVAGCVSYTTRARKRRSRSGSARAPFHRRWKPPCG